MKQQIRLNESQLRKMIKESVKRALHEGGHLYHKDPETGEIWTNSKQTWRGVPGTTYIWHGEWSDPEVIYNGVEFSANQLEDEFWVVFEDYMSQDDEREEFMKDTGCDGEVNNENYEKWLQWMGVDWMKSELDDLAWAMKESGELNESQLRKIVKESVKKILRESIEGGNYDQINQELSSWGARISPFYSDEYNLTVVAPTGTIREVKSIVEKYGYKFYDVGGSDDGKAMLTFKC